MNAVAQLCAALLDGRSVDSFDVVTIPRQTVDLAIAQLNRSGLLTAEWHHVGSSKTPKQLLFKAIKRHYCAASSCPGLPYKASEIAHPCREVAR